jgi:lambda family phage portal protein
LVRVPPRTTATLTLADLTAGYDAAKSTPDNRRHWANADFLSADAANSASVRQALRSRARYEVANNSYARGIVLTLANDLVGTGPRLQLLTPDARTNARLEAAWRYWAAAVGLAEKLRTMRMARAQDGEAFAVLRTNPALKTTVQLDLQLIEADRVASPVAEMPSPRVADGIHYDEYGNPISYEVLEAHPGSGLAEATRSARIPAERMIHWFRADRPEQRRGVPDLTSALPLFAQLRRYTLAVIESAETAASLAVIMKTTMPPNGEAAAIGDVELALERNTAVFAPEGWEAQQLEAQQPTAQYDMFVRAIVREIARCLNMPYNIAACDATGANYASGQLDQKTYYRSIEVERAQVEAVCLDRALVEWLAEARQVFGGLTLPSLQVPHEWFWDGLGEHNDPNRVASAQATRLRAGLTTAAQEFARQGLDWLPAFEQRAREVEWWTERLTAMGLTVEQAVNLALGQPAPRAGNAASSPISEGENTHAVSQ